ncbi:MAG: hypothetical protein F4Y27_14850 [Acidimicrobiaceae bacterium]|nr:hypothetical protein [Acidimicrobiaceae bacterium]MYG55135.1 hypothetical protein [Acidimicrobiaceae bacterium]MYJ98263.1 hypothetical protein [Acidimicrobiaceae bacterium]
MARAAGRVCATGRDDRSQPVDAGVQVSELGRPSSPRSKRGRLIVALIVDHLRSSIAELAATFRLSEDSRRLSELSDIEQRAIRTAAIKNFEITYELCRQLSQRWLKDNSAVGSKSVLTQAEVYRQAAANRLISDPEQWMHYHRARNNAAHEYNESKIVEIYKCIGLFIVDARQLLAALDVDND